MRMFDRQVRNGERLPFLYGLAYYRLDEQVAICYPVPFNLLVRWARGVWWKMVNPGVDAQMAIWNRGFQKGRALHQDWQKMQCKREYQRGLADGAQQTFTKLLQDIKEHSHR